MSALRPEQAFCFALRRLHVDADEACTRVYDRTWPDDREDYSDAWDDAVGFAEWGKIEPFGDCQTALEIALVIAEGWGVEGAIRAAETGLELLRKLQAELADS